MHFTNITRFEEVQSLFDGGSLLYTTSDCFIQLTLTSLNITNVKSNFIPVSAIPNYAYASTDNTTLSGGGLIRIKANKINLFMNNSIIKESMSLEGSGGVMNLIAKEIQGEIINNTIIGIRAK